MGAHPLRLWLWRGEMTPADQADEAASDLMRCYLKLGELAVTVRTVDHDVRVICPDGDRPRMARMLRLAATMLDIPKDLSIN
jgi:hypothetical protein